MIMILEALIKWEDKLLGQKFIIVTDHKSLKYFKMQPNLSSHQTRWWEYISRFNFTIQHVDGTSNQVVDFLSHYYELDYLDDEHPNHKFVSANAKLDPDAELLPVQQYVELCSAVARRSHCLAEQVKQRVLNSDQMNNRTSDSTSESSDNDSLLAIESVRDRWALSMD